MGFTRRTLVADCEISTGMLSVSQLPPIFVGEAGALDVNITLKLNGQAYTPTSVTASMYLYWPGTTLQTSPVAMSVSGNHVTGRFTSLLTAMPGSPLLIIRLKEATTDDIIVATATPVRIWQTKGEQIVQPTPGPTPTPGSGVSSVNGRLPDSTGNVTVSDAYIPSDVIASQNTVALALAFLQSYKADIADVYTKAQIDTALFLKADKSDTYTKAQVDALISALFRYKGNKATYADIQAITTKAVGDVWFCEADSSEYAWDGSKWEKLGPVIDLSAYLTQFSIAGLTIDASHSTITAAQLRTALDIYTKSEVDTLVAAAGSVSSVNGVSPDANKNVQIYAEDIDISPNNSDSIADVLDEKANQSSTYTKTEIDTYLNTKANSSDVNTALATKANQSTTYTKTETDTQISTAVNAIPKTAADLPMSSSDTQKLKDVLESTYVRTVNNIAPVNGNVNVSGGSGSSVGMYQVDATIATTDWVLNTTSNKYEATISNLTGVTSSMSFLEMSVDGDVAQFPVDVTTQNGSILLEIEEVPTVAWNQVHIVVGVNGASVLDDVIQDRADILAIKNKMGYNRAITMVGVADMVDAINQLDARPSGGGSGEFGMIPINATIAVSDWTLNSTSGKYEATITNANVTSTMSGLEAWLDDESLQPETFEILAQNGSVKVISNAVPSAAITIHIVLGTDGADTLADVSTLIAQMATKANAIPNAHQTTYGTDLNNYTDTGLYGIEGATNYPAGDSTNQYGTLIVNRYLNTDYVTQIWQTVLSNKAWIRIKTSGTWGAWSEVALEPKTTNLNLGEVASIESAWDAISVYDKTVTGWFGLQGKWLFIAYKYNDSQYGMMLCRHYNEYEIYSLHVTEGVKRKKKTTMVDV